MTQTTETVEEMGIKLQTVARKAFPSLVGKEWDRLLKGRFFHCLANKWQRKLGAPKPNETFEERWSAMISSLPSQQLTRMSLVIRRLVIRVLVSQQVRVWQAKPTAPLEREQSKSKQGQIDVLIVGDLATLLSTVMIRKIRGELRPLGEVVSPIRY